MQPKWQRAETGKHSQLDQELVRKSFQNSKSGNCVGINIVLLLLLSCHHCSAHDLFRQKSSPLVPYSGNTIDKNHRESGERIIAGLKPLGKSGNRVILAFLKDEERCTADVQLMPPSKMFKSKVTFPHKKATILTLLVTILLPSYLLPSLYLSQYLKGNTPLVLLLTTVILYIGEAACCSTRKYLSNTVTPKGLEELLTKIRNSEPIITWHTECYHYRTHVTYDSKGRSTRSQTKVVTHRASRQFSYRSWMDETPETLSKIASDAVQVAPYVKVKLSPCVKFANEATLQDYQDQQSQFLSFESRKDVHMDHHTTLEVDGLQPRILVSTTGLGAIPIFERNYFWLFTLLGLTVPYRRWISSHCGELDAVIDKQVCT